MIWIQKLPVPPSANELYETNVTKCWKKSKAGQPYMGFKTSRRKSDVLQHFQLQCLSFKNTNLIKIGQIRNELLNWIKDGFVLRVDTFIAFERSRIWTKDGQPQVIDADNRRKALQDGLAKILDIDDKWFFSGNIEKVTCDQKESECSLIRISPVKCRSLTEINNLRNTADF